MLSCKDVTHLASESRDRELGAMERMGMHMHLWICKGCRRFTQHMELLGQAMRMAGKEPERIGDPDARLSQEAGDRIRSALQRRLNGGGTQD